MNVKNIIPEYKDSITRDILLQRAYANIQKTLYYREKEKKQKKSKE
jgi:hypothetical protein